MSDLTGLKELTSAGTTVVSIMCLITFVLVFIRFVLVFIRFVQVEEVRSCYNSVARVICYLFGLITAALVTAVVFVTTLMLLAINLKDSKNDYRVIYSNDLKATVSFVTDPDEREFIGGQKVKEISDRHSGTLTLSKDGVKVTKPVASTEYLGDVEKGSIVEKIEYSNSLQETKVFGSTLMTNKENRLKIYLKKPKSEKTEEDKNSKIEKELNSLLESSH